MSPYHRECGQIEPCCCSTTDGWGQRYDPSLSFLQRKYLWRSCVSRLQFENSPCNCHCHRLKCLHPTYAPQEGVSNDRRAANQVRIEKKGEEEHTSIESSISSPDSSSCSRACSFLRRAARCARIMLIASSSPLEGSAARTRFRFFGLIAKPGTCLTDQSNSRNTSSDRGQRLTFSTTPKYL
jgi:hypothetical protein